MIVCCVSVPSVCHAIRRKLKPFVILNVTLGIEALSQAKKKKKKAIVVNHSQLDAFRFQQELFHTKSHNCKKP